MKTNHVLIDFENVQVRSLELLRPAHFRIRVFLGPTNLKLPRAVVLAMQEFGDRASYTGLDTGGRNAPDFHLAYYLGVWSAANPSAFFHIISGDAGFDPLLRHLEARRILCARSTSIEDMPCFAARPITEDVGATTSRCDVPFDRERLVEEALTDLTRRGVSRPGSMKTLTTTLHSRLGKELARAEIDAVCAVLVERGHVSCHGPKLSYDLPDPSLPTA